MLIGFVNQFVVNRCTRWMISDQFYPQACLGLSGTHQHTLNNRMAGCQIHIGLLSLEFLSMCSSVLYVVYVVIVCIIHFFFGILHFIIWHWAQKLYLIILYWYGLNILYIIYSKVIVFYYCTAMFFLTILYQEKAQSVAVSLSSNLVFIFFLYITVLKRSDKFRLKSYMF